MSTTNLFVKLASVQVELKAPKSQYNTFGKYHYRNCEDICEAVKPLLLSHGLTLTISDEIVLIGERYYIKASATVTDGTLSHCVTAYARESMDKKGMDDSQITGAASSYARKYALNGLFLIDDTKDADSDEKPKAEKQKTYPQSDFDKNLAAWSDVIKSGKHTASTLIAMIETKAPLTDAQKKIIEGVK